MPTDGNTQLHLQWELAVTFMHKCFKWHCCIHFASYKVSFCEHVYAVACNYIMKRKFEQRTNMKFCVHLGKSATETLSMLRQAYYNEAIGCMKCLEWPWALQMWKNVPRRWQESGRSATRVTPRNVEKINRLVHKNHWRKIKILLMLLVCCMGPCRQSQCLNWTVVKRVEEPFISMTWEGMTEPQLNQEHVKYLFDIHVILHWGLVLQNQPLIKSSTAMFWNIWGKMFSESD